jgi:uncharacterized protein with PhoU and TrkA domain
MSAYPQPEDPRIIFNDRHVHTFHIEPGSEGKTIGELELPARFGVGEVGIRNKGTTTTRIQPSRTLLADEVLIAFVTDQTARELALLFATGKKP